MGLRGCDADQDRDQGLYGRRHRAGAVAVPRRGLADSIRIRLAGRRLPRAASAVAVSDDDGIKQLAPKRWAVRVKRVDASRGKVVNRKATVIGTKADAI